MYILPKRFPDEKSLELIIIKYLSKFSEKELKEMNIQGLRQNIKNYDLSKVIDYIVWKTHMKKKIPKEIMYYHSKKNFDEKVKTKILIDNFFENIMFKLGNFDYYISDDNLPPVFIPFNERDAPYVGFPIKEFYRFDDIGEYLQERGLLNEALIYYPQIGEKMLRKISPFSNPIHFGKKKKKKKKKKLSSDIKKKCKKKGIRLTYKRNGKRVYKTEKVLKKQLANRS